MDQFNTRTYIKKGFIFFGVLILLALVYPTYQWFANPTTGISDPTELDFGLDPSTNEVTALPSGYLYLYGMPDTTSTIYVLDLYDRSEKKVPTQLSAEQLADNDGLQAGLFIGGYNNVDNLADALHPSWIDYRSNEWYRYDTPTYWNESVIQVPSRKVSSRQWLAYAAQIEKIDRYTDSQRFYDLDNWDIILHNPYIRETRIIEDAARPQWLNEGKDLIYIKNNGVYRYNIEADVHEQLATGWSDLNWFSELTVADDSSAFILTIPGANSVAVYTFTDSLNGDTQLLGVIAEEGVVRSNPTFDDTGRYYAIRKLDTNNNQFPEVLVDIEIRSLVSRDVIETITLKSTAEQLPVVLDWRNSVEPFEWR